MSLCFCDSVVIGVILNKTEQLLKTLFYANEWCLRDENLGEESWNCHLLPKWWER